MEHKYSTKFKNKNLRFAKVGLRVFRGLFPAESYCTAHDLDVNSAIEYGDFPELKVKVQERFRKPFYGVFWKPWMGPKERMTGSGNRL